MTEEPRTTDPGPAPTSKTTETRTERTEFLTSSDVRTSTSETDEDARGQGEQVTDDQRDRNAEDARGQGEEARDDQRDRNAEDARGQGEEARDDQRDRNAEGARGQGAEARDDQRDPGDAPKGESFGSKLGNALGL